MRKPIEFTTLEHSLEIRWDDHVFYVTMLHVVCVIDFPTDDAWNESAPNWAQGQWRSISALTQKWCDEHSLVFVIAPTGLVNFEGKPF